MGICSIIHGKKPLDFTRKTEYTEPVMKRSSKKFGSAIPELRVFVEKYGADLKDNPPYILLGKYQSKGIGLVMGVLAAATNEFHAHILRREIRKGGHCEIKTTEFFSGKSTFSIAMYKEKYKEKIAQKELQRKEAE